jgi:hypothetical protein
LRSFASLRMTMLFGFSAAERPIRPPEGGRYNL